METTQPHDDVDASTDSESTTAPIDEVSEAYRLLESAYFDDDRLDPHVHNALEQLDRVILKQAKSDDLEASEPVSE